MRIRRRIVWGLLLLVVLGIAGTLGGFYTAGYRAYVIHTGSMEPTLMPGDLIIDRPADGHYHVGDVITFRHGPTADLVTHRLVGSTPEGVHTKGDANRTADVWTIPETYVEGVVRWHVPGLGFAVVFLKQPTGLLSVILMLGALALLWRLFFPTEQPEPEPAENDTSAGENLASGCKDEAPTRPDPAPAVPPDLAELIADDRAPTDDEPVPDEAREPVAARA
jgi:signal peptidase